MTISTNYAPKRYKPGSAMAAEPIPFQFLDPADIVVTHIADATGIRTVLVPGTHYAIAGSGPAGSATVRALSAWPTDDLFEVTRETERLQTASIVPHEPLPADEVEQQLNRQALVGQEIGDSLDTLTSLAVTVPRGETGFAVPTIANRAGKLAGFGTSDTGAKLIHYEIAAADLVTIAAIQPDIGLVADVSAAVPATAAIASDITTVAGISVKVTTLADNITAIDAVYADINLGAESSYILQSLQAATTATIKAAEAAESEENAFTYATQAAGSLALYLAAGTSAFTYLTKAEANAALAGLANGTTFRVIADESQGNLLTFYVKTAGVAVLQASPFAKALQTYDPRQLGAIGSGNDAAAINSMAATALAIGGQLHVTGDLNIPTGVTVTLPDIPITFVGGDFIGGGTLNISGTIVAPPVRIFADALTVKLNHQRQPHVYAEWWGAKPLANLKTTAFDANNIDSSDAFQKALTCGMSFDGSNPASRFTIKCLMLGAYGVSKEIFVNKSYINIQGTTPNYGGSGFVWIGAHDSTKKILKVQGAQFSTIHNVFFMVATKSNDPAAMMRAGVSLTWDGSSDTQRRLDLRNLTFGDTLGAWAKGYQTGYYFQAGILVEGTIGNNDFLHTENLLAVDCIAGIENNSDQAGWWTINNYGATGCRIMYLTTRGGTIYGDNWYASRETAECVIKAWQGAGQSYQCKIRIRNFSTEHCKAPALIVANMPVQGEFGADAIQFSAEAPTATFSQSGTTLTCTGNAPAPGFSAFFSESMLGQHILFADGTYSGLIVAIAADRRSATVSINNPSVLAQSGRLVDAQAYRTPYVLWTNDNRCFFSIKFGDTPLNWTTTFGTPNPTPAGDPAGVGAGTRIGMFMPGSHTSTHVVNFQGCEGARLLWVMGGAGTGTFNQPRVVHYNIQHPRVSSAGFSGSYFDVPMDCSVPLIGRRGQDASGQVNMAQFIGTTYFSSNTTVLGRVDGGPGVARTRDVRRVTTPSSNPPSVLTAAGYFAANRNYEAVNVAITANLAVIGQSSLYGIALGLTGDPWRFALLSDAFLTAFNNSGWSTGRGHYQTGSTAVDLKITGIYAPPGTLAQSGTTVTASDAQAFGTRTITANLPGQTIYWYDAAGLVTATAVIQTRDSATTCTVTDSKTVAAGAARITYPFTASKPILITSVYGSFDLTGVETNRLNSVQVPALATT